MAPEKKGEKKSEAKGNFIKPSERAWKRIKLTSPAEGPGAGEQITRANSRSLQKKPGLLLLKSNSEW
jgi:hypothetical protein